MPKIRDTRKDKAQELLALVLRGPSTSFDIFKHEPPTDANINRQYKLWAETWVVPMLKELVPELKQANKASTRLEAGAENADSESNPAVSSG